MTVSSEPTADPDPKPDPDPDPEPKPNAEADVEVEAAIEVETDAETEAIAVAKTDTVPDGTLTNPDAVAVGGFLAENEADVEDEAALTDAEATEADPLDADADTDATEADPLDSGATPKTNKWVIKCV